MLGELARNSASLRWSRQECLKVKIRFVTKSGILMGCLCGEENARVCGSGHRLAAGNRRRFGGNRLLFRQRDQELLNFAILM